MIKFIQCIGYLAAVGILSFLIGRILPKKWFNCDEAPFKSFPSEKEGRIYERLHIRQWKDKAPDMSRILPALMPGRAPKPGGQKKDIELLLQETCIAETVHVLLCFIGIGCAYIWPGAGGVTIALLYAVGNIPFVVIQRYNRPRLIRIRNRMTVTKPKAARISTYEGETA